MTPEQEFERTKEETKRILEDYKIYLIQKKLIPHFQSSDFDFKFIPTSTYFDYDAIFFLDNVRKLHVEVKVRTDITLNTYPYSKIPLRKHAVALYYFLTSKVKTHYLVKFSDGLFQCPLHDFPDDVKDMPNRWDRGGEINEYALYHHSRFEHIIFE